MSNIISSPQGLPLFHDSLSRINDPASSNWALSSSAASTGVWVPGPTCYNQLITVPGAAEYAEAVNVTLFANGQHHNSGNFFTCDLDFSCVLNVVAFDGTVDQIYAGIGYYTGAAGVFFRSSSGPNWLAVERVAGGTNTDTGIPVTTGYVSFYIRMRAGICYYYINNALVMVKKLIGFETATSTKSVFFRCSRINVGGVNTQVHLYNASLDVVPVL